MTDRADLAKEIAESRQALIGTLTELTDDRWDAPSLCTEWSVRELVAHLIRVGDYYRRPWTFWPGLVLSGFRLGRFLTRDARRRAAGNETTDLLAALAATRYEQTLTWRLHPWPAMALGELVIHGQDIRRPLGLREAPTTSQLRIVADLLVRPVRLDPLRFPWGAPRRPRVRFEATDADWAAGDGPLVGGRLEAIVMVLAGRMQAASDLSGEGLEAVRAP